ncbi:MAG: GTP 3',8-cyclase MoaA [Thermoprotei archaeon]
MLIDRFGRPVTHLRISVTNRCNHKCIFCHREGIPYSDPSRELSSSDWGFLAHVAINLGIKYYKITGGEPLIRNDIVGIISEIKEAGGSVSIVTNGSLLDKHARELAESGIEYVNVSLHSLDPEKFRKITGGNLDRVLNGIREAVDHGIRIRIDYVVLSWNFNEYRNIIEYASRNGFDLNIIELIPLGITIDEWKNLHRSLDEIENYLETISVAKRVREFQSRPVYILPSGIEITLVKGVCNPELCMKCTRLRMTPEGYIKTCIYRNDQLVDARKYILARDKEGLVNAFKKATSIREPFFKPGITSNVKTLYENLRFYSYNVIDT